MFILGRAAKRTRSPPRAASCITLVFISIILSSPSWTAAPPAAAAGALEKDGNWIIGRVILQ